MVDTVVDTLEEFVRERLLTGSPVYDDRVYPMRMPAINNPEFPLLTYKRISAPRQYTHDGYSLSEPRIQISIWDKTYDGMIKASEEVKQRLNAWKDDSKGIQHCFLMFELDQWEEQTGLFKKMLDAQIGWKGH